MSAGESVNLILRIHFPHGLTLKNKSYVKLRINGCKDVGHAKDMLRKHLKDVPAFELYRNEHATEIESDTETLLNFAAKGGEASDRAELTAELWMRETAPGVDAGSIAALAGRI